MKGISVASGHMYDWVTHMWSPVRGCPHGCSYCYARPDAEPKLLPYPWPTLGEGRTIFVGHLCDMWAEAVGDYMIRAVLAHIFYYPLNTYVFQTKNPDRLLAFEDRLPQIRMVGTTIETNRQPILDSVSKAPAAGVRAAALSLLRGPKFLTLEPILDFDIQDLLALILLAKPDFVNIGADSKGHGLPEPSVAKVLGLVQAMGRAGIMIRKKNNLGRLTTGTAGRE